MERTQAGADNRDWYGLPVKVTLLHSPASYLGKDAKGPVARQNPTLHNAKLCNTVHRVGAVMATFIHCCYHYSD